MAWRETWIAAAVLAAALFVPSLTLAQGTQAGSSSPQEVPAGAETEMAGEAPNPGEKEEAAPVAAPTGDAEDDGEDVRDLGSDPASESDAGPDAEVPAWRAAATPEQQASARRLFQEGNQLVKESLFVQAVAKYEEALAQWDHPGIHYNLALALLNLDQPLRLRKHLVESLKYGEVAVGLDKARRAKQYIALVEKQLTDLRIHSEQAGARIELDGELLFVAPGEYRDFVRPGQHTLKATAPGFETTERSLSLVAGEHTDLPVRLYTAEDWIQTERRWRPWGPIVVTGSGVAVLSLGGMVYAAGVSKVKDFDERVAKQCANGGCAAGEIAESPTTGKTFQGAGIATMVLGGATVVTGGVLLYLNRRIPHRVDPEADDQLSLAPMVGPGIIGLTGRGVF